MDDPYAELAPKPRDEIIAWLTDEVNALFEREGLENAATILGQYFVAIELVEAGISDYIGMEEHNARVEIARRAREAIAGRRIYQ